MGYCSSCGAELKEGNRFCRNCGAKLELEIETAQKPESVPARERVYEKPAEKAERISGPASKKWVRVIGVILILLVVFVAGAVAIFSIYSNMEGREEIGDIGEAKDIVLLDKKESVIGEKSTAIYTAEYKWRGTTYRARAIRKVEGEPPIAPPEVFSDTMDWIKENTPKDAVILSWWDYGHWIRLFGSRETVISDPCKNKICQDTVTPNTTFSRFEPVEKVEDVARFFTSNEEEAYSIIQKYGVDYVMVSYEEFGKSGAINHIAQDTLYFLPSSVQSTGDQEKDEEEIKKYLERNNITSYYIVNYGNRYEIWITGLEPTSQGYIYHPEMKDKLLAKLLPFNTGKGQDLEHFKLEYIDEYNYVLIYKVI